MMARVPDPAWGELRRRQADERREYLRVHHPQVYEQAREACAPRPIANGPCDACLDEYAAKSIV